MKYIVITGSQFSFYYSVTFILYQFLGGGGGGQIIGAATTALSAHLPTPLICYMCI
jgi:hypothetical protein